MDQAVPVAEAPGHNALLRGLAGAREQASSGLSVCRPVRRV